MDGIKFERAKEIIDNCKGKKIAIVGDIMLDRFFWGAVSRVSPEAPVPVVDLERESYHLGGAANVANNLKSLNVDALLCGVIGNDDSGFLFKKIIEKKGICPNGIFSESGRPTTVKTRIIGNNQHIARLDSETRERIEKETENYFIDFLEKQKNLSAIIFADYDKGAITENLIYQIITNAKKRNIPVFVDPKYKNFFSYKNATVFKPNKKEASISLNFDIKNMEDVKTAGKKLLEKIECKNVLITLGADGMLLFEGNGDVLLIPTKARMVSDVSGAGDTTIATLAAAVAGSATLREAAVIANYAAGVVCEAPGVVPIEIDKLFKSINNKRNLL